MADNEERTKDKAPVAEPTAEAGASSPSSAPASVEAKRAPSWVTEDPFPRSSLGSNKVELDPSLRAELRSGVEPSPEGPIGSRLSGASSTVASSKEPARADLPRSSSATGDGRLSEPRYRVPGRLYLGLPWWGWPLVGVGVLGLIFLLSDLGNRNSFLVVCSGRKVELQQARRLPFPFGYEPVGGPEYKPIVVPEGDWRRPFGSEEDAAREFLDVLLGQVRGGLTNPGASNLRDARQQLEQALLLTRTQRGRRKETESMLAELSYRDGRVGVARAENELRLALTRFQEALKLDARRFDDLEQWIAHLEEMLRGITPAPFSSAGPRPGPGHRPSSRPAAPPASRPAGAPPPPPPTPADAGPPPNGAGGILM